MQVFEKHIGKNGNSNYLHTFAKYLLHIIVLVISPSYNSLGKEKISVLSKSSNLCERSSSKYRINILAMRLFEMAKAFIEKV